MVFKKRTHFEGELGRGSGYLLALCLDVGDEGSEQRHTGNEIEGAGHESRVVEEMHPLLRTMELELHVRVVLKVIHHI
ncbi:hypothetical protein TNCV_1729211 [Trichonephila clavipes]|nr:hypothetical protein TNCV_1729211 [Trichonephila clavipes]